MRTLGPRKKNLMIAMIAIVVGALIISVVLDIMTNNGGRVILVGAIAGVVIAAAVFLVSNVISKKSSAADAYSDSEDNRFRRNRGKSDDLFDAAGFEDDGMQQNDAVFDDFESDAAVESEPQGELESRFATPPSQQLRERGFFGRKRAEVEEPVEESFEAFEAEEETVWQEPQYEDGFEAGFESDYETEFESDEYSDMEFDAPVIAFGNPEPAEEFSFDEPAAEESYEEAIPEEAAEEPAEEAVYAEPDFEEEPVFEEEPAAEEQEILPEADVQPAAEPEPANSLLLKDIHPGMVVASQSPGQSLESFYADMSEEDIIYRDCVEVWSSAAKNPMMKILGSLSKIEDKKVAGELGRECEYVNAMIDRMLYFTQLEMIDQALNMQVYNYSVLVKECLKRFSPFFTEKKISLLWKGLDVNVITDKRWFIFAMTQVIFNSIEFTPHGGKIAVSAKKTDDYVDLIIDDSGEGMDEEELPYAFTAGFMGDEAPNPDDTRTGMGLFITRSVMQKMGGECMAESSKGKGMRIVIRLPAMKEEN